MHFLKNKSVESNTFWKNNSKNALVTYKIRKDRTTYSLFEIQHDETGKIYEPIPSTDIAQSYQHEPTTAIDGGFSCQYTVFVEKDESGRPNYDESIKFGKFAMQHNSKSAPEKFSNVRDCVGLWTEASVIGVLTGDFFKKNQFQIHKIQNFIKVFYDTYFTCNFCSRCWHADKYSFAR